MLQNFQQTIGHLNWPRIKEFLKIFILAMAAIFIVLLTIALVKFYVIGVEEKNKQTAAAISDSVIRHLDDNYFTPAEGWEYGCNVVGIELHGDLTTYGSSVDAEEEDDSLYAQTASEDIVFAIEDAENNYDVKAIVLEVDSNGGYPVAAEEVANALKRAQKPTVALIRESGNSAAYFAATGADVIFASKNTDLGSIAVNGSYLDYSRQNQQEGITYVSLSSGKFKETGDPDKPLTWEERELLMRNINILHNNFVDAVAENRGMDRAAVAQLADGSVMIGEMALENGLIDYIGGMAEVREYLSELIGWDAEVCWY
ncbi:MAG: S49 family peptidase [Candidatus Staskawiczbacteria bacterium]|nr:S49 family peptidase [Candidatus Staskawiczbacteria bacterium]